MKTIIVFAALIAVAMAGVLTPTATSGAVALQPEAVLVKETPSDNVGLGGYNYGYELSDGQTKEETAELVPGGTDGHFLKVRGSFQFVDPITSASYTVHYIADENGFQPQGAHLPHA